MHYLLKKVCIAGYHYFTGNFIECGKVIDDATEYIILNFKKNQENVKIPGQFLGYAAGLSVLKIFILYLTGRQK